jgi:flagellar biogenesis protein FliO
VVGSLAVVLGAFFLVAWATRRAAPRRFQLLPPEVVDCLGRAPLAGRQQLQLMRLGKKLVLLSVTATDARALCEVTDPAEVDRIAGLCQQTRPESVTTSFRQALAQCATESVPRSTPTATGAAIAGRVPRSDVRVLHQQRGA